MSPRGIYDHKPKTHPTEMIDAVRDLYVAQGLAQREVGDRLGVSQHTVSQVMRRYGIPARSSGAPPGLFAGPANPNWKGDAASYSAFHYRLTQLKGQPQHCSNCDTSDPSLSYDWANLTGDYADVDDYARMCRPCHRNYDNARQETHPS